MRINILSVLFLIVLSLFKISAIGQRIPRNSLECAIYDSAFAYISTDPSLLANAYLRNEEASQRKHQTFFLVSSTVRSCLNLEGNINEIVIDSSTLFKVLRKNKLVTTISIYIPEIQDEKTQELQISTKFDRIVKVSRRKIEKKVIRSHPNVPDEAYHFKIILRRLDNGEFTIERK